MGWEGPMEAAQFCVENNFNYDEALKWIDLSISRKPNFQNKIIKAKLLERLSRVKDAKLVIVDAINNSSEQELNLFGYELLNKNRIEKALDVFRTNVERHPNSWNCYNSYADALIHNNRRNEAIINYKKALKLAPKSQKERIETLLKKGN
jgi:tetratricopeptide (TPR) repeat protein